ncbi:hypothetical protein OF83DRAFT_1121755 [Amylostereum chailletii]|nr:hypothetical protein OF83DRAFT_1121755 [Amylostereum chailletii]
MSRNENLSKIFILDFDLFHPERLASDEDLAVALQVFEGSIDTLSLPHIIEGALKVELALAFALSVVDDTTVKPFMDFFMAEFPMSRNSFKYTSIHVQCFSSLSLSLLRLDPVRDVDPADVDHYRRSVELAPRVLRALTSMLNDPTFGATKRPRNKSKAMSRPEGGIDVKAFQDLDMKVPANKEEAEELEEKVLRRQRDILMFFLQMVRRPEVASSIKDEYMTSSSPASTATLPISPPTDRALGQSPALEDSTTVLPEGDARSSQIVYNKLVELSHGQFSNTNQKRINNSGSVDIFAARLPGALRLVVCLHFVSVG